MRPYLVACLPFLAAPAGAQDLWGCEVRLCLAAPDGWQSIPECVPPMERLFEHLRRRRPMPPCPEADEPVRLPPPIPRRLLNPLEDEQS